MNKDAKSRRLDKIELQLTPKQWAIRLADEIRRYASQEDFMKAMGKGTYRQTPFNMPFYALAQQAKESWPGKSPEHIRKGEELYRKLRMEYQALKMLINNVNREIETKTETIRLKAALQLSKLQTLTLQDAFAQTGLPETMPASLARSHLLSQLEDWADDSVMLFMEIIPYKTAVQTIQENYFESHPILYRDNEIAFEIANRTVRDAIAAFNEYFKVRAELSNRESDHEEQKAGTANAMLFERESSLPIDIEAVEKHAGILVDSIVENWVMNAKFKANADILRETGKHEDFIWQQFRKEMGLES
jgi:hypothetical protein